MRMWNERMWSGMTRLLTAAVVSVVLMAAGSANGTTMTYVFDGMVTFVPTELASEFSAGESISGIYPFDTDALDLNVSPDLGSYPYDSFDVAIDDYTASSADGRIEVWNDIGGFDIYRVQNLDALVGDSVGAWMPTEFTLQLNDDTASVFDSDDLPLTVPDLEDSMTSIFRLSFEDGSGQVRTLDGTITSFSHVPEPSTALLFAGGLMGLVARRCRRSVRS
jgi:hypothetical protein